MRVLVIVVAALCSACASTGATPQPFPGRRAPSPSEPGSTVSVTPTTIPVGSSGYEISGTALSLRGTPYRNGGADPKGFDCSGLVWYVFARHGLAVPRTVEDQFKSGGEVRADELQAGDLVFFNTTDRGASHVGILIGGDSFIHAPNSSAVVRVDRLGSGYWAQRYLGARRLF